MSELKQNVLSREYVLVKVSSKQSGSWVNITSDTVQMAFPVRGVAPVAGDLKAASWETDTSTDPDTYYARCEVGPGGTVTLSEGVYDIYVKITDSPEIPYLYGGTLRITSTGG